MNEIELVPPRNQKMNTKDFTVKDSGQRQQFSGGMVRDVTQGKINYLLTRDGPMFRRWAEHLTKGAEKYDDRNWMKADGLEELERFRQSAARHFEQWLAGETDEDHAAAVFFNINGFEYLLAKMNADLDEAIRQDVEAFERNMLQAEREHEINRKLEGPYHDQGACALCQATAQEQKQCPVGEWCRKVRPGDLQREEEDRRPGPREDAVPPRPPDHPLISDASPGVVDCPGLSGPGKGGWC